MKMLESRNRVCTFPKNSAASGKVVKFAANDTKTASATLISTLRAALSFTVTIFPAAGSYASALPLIRASEMSQESVLSNRAPATEGLASSNSDGHTLSIPLTKNRFIGSANRNIPSTANTESRNPTCITENGVNRSIRNAASPSEDIRSRLSPKAVPRLSAPVIMKARTEDGVNAQSAT